MGWTNSHLHEFDLGDVRYGMTRVDGFDDGLDDMQDEAGVRLDTVCQPGDRFIYNYHFWDGWGRVVGIEKAVALEPGAPYPPCTPRRKARPPPHHRGPCCHS